MTFFTTFLTWLALLFCAALTYELYRCRHPLGKPHCNSGLHACLRALRDADMLDAWSDIPDAVWLDARAQSTAAEAIRTYVQRPTCPIARADCMDCLSMLARRA